MPDLSLDRRHFLGLTGGALLALTVPSAPALAAGRGGQGRLVPDGKTGTILYTQRDAVGRPGISTGQAPKGYLGGPEWMSTPEDLGPLVDLPGGFDEVFQFLASVGYKQVEFAGFGQHALNRGGAAPSLGTLTNNPQRLYDNRAAYLEYIRTLRSFLDAAGLSAIGSHGYIPSTWDGPGSPAVAGTTAGQMHPWERDRFLLELEAANILGMPYTGTGGDPTGAGNRNVEAWDVAAEKWLALNALAASSGIAVYPHNHAPAYHFLQDGPMVTVNEHRITGAPIAPTQVRGESGTRLMEHYLRSTDRSCPIELDVFWAHVAQHQHRWYYDWEGKRRELVFDPTAFAAANTHRIPLFHAKDGDRADNINGYDMVPFRDARSDIEYERFFAQQGAKGFHNPNYEQDNAPGGAVGDHGRSLRYSRFSAQRMRAMRG